MNRRFRCSYHTFPKSSSSLVSLRLDAIFFYISFFYVLLYSIYREKYLASNDHDEETAYESYMNPETGFQSGPGDSAVSADAD